MSEPKRISIFIKAALYIAAGIAVWYFTRTPEVIDSHIAELPIEIETDNRKKQLTPLVVPEEQVVPVAKKEKSKRSTFDEPSPGDIQNEWLLRFDNDADFKRYIIELQKAGVKDIKVIPNLRSVRVTIKNDKERHIIDKLTPPGAGAGFNQRVEAPPLTKAPPKEYDANAMFEHTALEWLGTPDDIEDWGKGVTIAVLDSGVVEHPALKDKIATSLDLTQSDEAVSVDDLIHGTAVASLISGENSFAKGIAPGAKIMSLRVLNGDGEGDHFALAHGIVYAVDNGAKVINLSLGGYNSSSTLESAIQYAVNNDVSLIAAVGNDGTSQISYPAAYPDVIAVGAIDALGEATHFSNSGSEMDIAAPGLGILSAAGSRELSHFSGTSAAAPYVAGTIAYLRGQDPSMSAEEAAAIILNNANDTDAPGFDPSTGHGILNLERITTRNESGLYDGAVSNIVLDPENTGGVIISVQNRGNEDFDQGAELVVKSGNYRQSFPIEKLTPNQSSSINWQDPTLLAALQEGSNITAYISINGAEDDRDHNDSASVFLKIGGENEEEL